MTVTSSVLLTIILAGIVTWVPRVLPFIISKKVTFPPPLNKFLSYLPMCILSALFMQSLLQAQNGSVSFLPEPLLASLPTAFVAVLTKDLMWTVVVGILSMACLRFIL